MFAHQSLAFEATPIPFHDHCWEKSGNAGAVFAEREFGSVGNRFLSIFELCILVRGFNDADMQDA